MNKNKIISLRYYKMNCDHGLNLDMLSPLTYLRVITGNHVTLVLGDSVIQLPKVYYQIIYINKLKEMSIRSVKCVIVGDGAVGSKYLSLFSQVLNTN